MACAPLWNNLAIVRGASRAIIVRVPTHSYSSCISTSSSPIISTVGNNGRVAQGRSLNQILLQRTSTPSSGFVSSSFTFQQPYRNISTFCRSAPAENSLSFAVASKLITTPFESPLQSKRIIGGLLSNTKVRMAAATVVVPEKKYSSAVLQPQIDALDDSVDPVQRQLLEEQCIVLNDQDQVIGHDTKRNCHRIVDGDVLLHRAFSVFLFNGKGELLLQQRSKTKITFPLLWTNTCCSHPLYTPSELEEKEAIGVKRAARRRLEIELGIPQNSINLNEFQYLTRIHYKALSDSIWGEHEIDYILFLQKDDLHIDPSPEEIREIRWVTWKDVKEMVAKENVSLTPWFELIMNSRLPEWWNNLKDLNKFKDHEQIHRLN